jgi:serine/threonine protein phosphatase PrpC
MADFLVQAGFRSAQGLRPNNEDRFYVDPERKLFLVADGMGGQERGEQASAMAAEIVPRVLRERLAAGDSPSAAVQRALTEANQAIVDAGQNQPFGRRMGTTAVLALLHDGKVYVSGLGDSRAYLLRDGKAQQLTVDHSVAHALFLSGALTEEEARMSPYQHVLHKYLGCPTLLDGAEVREIEPEPHDRLFLASDGLTNFVTDSDLSTGPGAFPNLNAWVEHLVELALERGSRDNVTCVVVEFEKPG